MKKTEVAIMVGGRGKRKGIFSAHFHFIGVPYPIPWGGDAHRLESAEADSSSKIKAPAPRRLKYRGVVPRG